MDLLFLGGLGYLVSKVTANIDDNVSENMSNDTVYSNNSSNKLKNSLKKKAKRRKKLSKAEKIRVSSPVKKTQQTLLLSETTDSESETLKARNQNLSNLDSNYNYQDQFATLKYDCNEPIAFNGLDRDELRHVMNERELFAMGAPISKDGTYNVVPKNEFEHNNMQHFTKMNGLKHDDHRWKNRNSMRSKHTGYIEHYQSKKEVKNMFKPQKDVYADKNINITNVADRFIPGKEKRNQLPFEQIKVTPGLNLGYEEEGQQGFHDSYRPPQINADKLRGKKNKKITFTKPIIEGKKGTAPAVKPKITKRRPPRVVKLKHGANTRKQDQMIKKSYQRKKFVMKETGKGKKNKNLGVKMSYVKRDLPEKLRPRVKKPVKTLIKGKKPGNKKGMVQMYDPKMQNFVLPCTQRNSTNVAALPGPAFRSGNRVDNMKKLKTTKKETILFNREGAAKARINKQQTYDPNDKPRTTKKETILFNREGAAKARINKQQTYDPNDKPRTTKKETILFNREGAAKARINKQQTYDPNDKPRTTKKETILFNREGGTGAKGIINKPQTFNPNDVPKITIKQGMIHNKHKGNVKGFKQQTYQIDYKDVPADTLKQILVAYQRHGQAKSLIPKGQTIDYNNIPAQTLKELVIHNKYTPGLYNVNATKGGYLSNKYQAPATLKEALNNLFYVGSIHSNKTGGYVSNAATAKTTLRQMLHVFRMSGIGKYLSSHRTYAAEYNAETPAGRETLGQGRAPTTRKQDVPNGAFETNIRKKEKLNSARPQHGVNPIVGRPKFKQRMKNSNVENKRADFSIAKSQLKNNKFAIKFN
jgi:hypothetical protein